MDDELGSRGSDWYLWYQQGEMAAESRREDEARSARLTGKAPVSRQEYNRVVQIANQWQAECQRLQATNGQLAVQLRTADEDYTKLKAWADDCARWRDEWKQRYEDQKDLTFAMSSRANRFQIRLERLERSGNQQQGEG